MITRRGLIKLAGASLLLPTQARALTEAVKYPILNTNNPLASGMIAAYFPGYGAPVTDATGNWKALTAQPFASAGALTSDPAGRAMAFDGLHDGLWATSSSPFPLQNATNFTMAMVININGPCHEYGAGLCLASSTRQGIRLHLGWFTDGLPAGQGQFVVNGVYGSVLAEPQTMPTGVTVVVGTFDTSNQMILYLNGKAAGSLPIRGNYDAVIDTVALGVRPQSAGTLPITGCILHANSDIMTGLPLIEDTILGAPMTDTVGAVPAGTYCTAYDGSSTYTMSQPALASTSQDSIYFGAPITRLANCQIYTGIIWNRILTNSEIVAFSDDPTAPFDMPFR